MTVSQRMRKVLAFGSVVLFEFGFDLVSEDNGLCSSLSQIRHDVLQLQIAELRQDGARGADHVLGVDRCRRRAGGPILPPFASSLLEPASGVRVEVRGVHLWWSQSALRRCDAI